MKHRWVASPLEGSSETAFADAEENSDTHRAPASGDPLSARLWGEGLEDRLPRELSSDGVLALRGALGRIRQFIERECPSLVEEALGGVAQPPIAAAKHCYLHALCDLIELRHQDTTVGVFVGVPQDWSTYYVRVFVLAREFRRPALMRRFSRECLFEPLQACGVQRVVAETSPANLPMSRYFTELQFYVTGQQLSERWGPLVRYTKFLDPASEALFRQRFGGTAPTPQR